MVVQKAIRFNGMQADGDRSHGPTDGGGEPADSAAGKRGDEVGQECPDRRPRAEVLMALACRLFIGDCSAQHLHERIPIMALFATSWYRDIARSLRVRTRASCRKSCNTQELASTDQTN